MAQKAIPKKVKRNIQDYLNYLVDSGISIKKAFVFGSYANGRQNKWSDIDICIISPDFRNSSRLLEYLWAKKRKKDTRAKISPVGFHPKEFINEDPLVWEIKKKGIEVTI